MRKDPRCLGEGISGSVSGENQGRQVGEVTLMTGVCPVSVKLLTAVGTLAVDTS